MAPKKDIADVNEAEQTVSNAGNPSAELKAQKERAKKKVLRREGDPIEKHRPTPTDGSDVANTSRFRTVHAIVILASVAMGLIAGAVLARLGGVLASGWRPVLIPLFAELVFLGIAFSLIHTLPRSR